MPATIAIVTCEDIADLESDDQLLLGPLRALGVNVEVAVWDDATVDWTRYDLVVIRSPWDYADRRDEFVTWARSVPRLVNDAATVAWNTDKCYLAELAGTGVTIVPTTWVLPGDPEWTPPLSGEWVIKPAISAGSRDTGRYDLSDPQHRGLAAAHVDRLIRGGRVVMIQPYLTAVDTYGETALIFFGGRYSHSIRKGPMLDGPDLGVPGLYKPEVITPREPTPAERELAERVLAALPADLAPPLYARVDVIPGVDGAPVLVELELTEPSLFLEHAAGAAARRKSVV